MATGQILLGNWDCRYTIEDKPDNTLAIALELTPGGGTLSEREASFRSPIELSLDFGDVGVRRVTNMTTCGASTGAGKNVADYATVDGIQVSDVRAIIVSFAGATERVAF